MRSLIGIALLTTALAGCQTPPPAAAPAPYPQRDLTVLWSERVYWAPPEGAMALGKPAARSRPAPPAERRPAAVPPVAAPRPLGPAAAGSGASRYDPRTSKSNRWSRLKAAAERPTAAGPLAPPPALPPAPAVDPAPAVWPEPDPPARTAGAGGCC